MSKNLEDTLSKALEDTKTIDMSQTQQFWLGNECEANKWTSEVLGKYVAAAAELPQYRSLFECNAVNGAKFICCLTERDLRNSLSLTENSDADMPILHLLKLKTHAIKLRAKVLGTAAEKLPSKFSIWGAHHIAGWLEYKFRCPNCASVILIANLSGKDINAKSAPEMAMLFQDCNPDECAVALPALQPYCCQDSASKTSELVDKIINSLNDSNGLADTSANVTEKPKKKGKKKIRRDV